MNPTPIVSGPPPAPSLPPVEPPPTAARPRAQTPAQLRVTLAGRLPALDGVRGLAIVLVLLHQFNILDGDASLPARVLAALFEPGWIGVQLFFVLSGFLITGILLDNRGEPGRFYGRRALRIFPLYYTVLVLAFLILPAAGILPAPAHQAWYWLYLQNWPSFSDGGALGLGHTWSLAVEEQFYLVWPLAVWGLSRRGLTRLCVGLLAGAFLLRVGLRLGHMAPSIVYESTLTRADALAMGSLGAIALRNDDWMPIIRQRLARWTVVSLIVLLAVAVAGHDLARKNFLTQTLGYSLLALAFTQLIMIAVLQTARGSGRLMRALSYPPLAAIGRVSYGMYIFHLPLHMWATRVLLARYVGPDGTENLALALGYMVAAGLVLFALAQVSWHLFEKRLLGLLPSRRV